MNAVTSNSSSLELYHATCAIYVTIPQPLEALKMTAAQVVETLVTVNNNSPIHDHVLPDDQTQPTFEATQTYNDKV